MKSKTHWQIQTCQLLAHEEIQFESESADSNTQGFFHRTRDDVQMQGFVQGLIQI